MAVQDQIMFSLVLFTERMTSQTLFGWQIIPSSLITSINPITVVLLGMYIAKQRVPMMFSFLITSAAFGSLTVFCFAQMGFSILGVMGM
ncbi:MAG: hypothetical protein K0S27_242 [Gammaproteobacteria bacterium]|jgi:dipeptide/tripeptide permease|nr:hypothetical protein [Gammaproteobacteria bacterium]